MSKLLDESSVTTIEDLISKLDLIVLQAQDNDDAISKETIIHLRDAHWGLICDRSNLISKLKE
jgi:hypothetical protein